MQDLQKGSVLEKEIRHSAARQKAGMIVLAAAIGLFALSPVCRAQAGAAGNDAVASGQSSVQAGNADLNPAANDVQPGVRVVRLSLVEGTVQVLHGNQVEFPQAVMNMPLRQGTQVKTGANGRAEVEFEDGSVARITPNSALSIDQLGIGPEGALMTTVGQQSGLVYYELRGDPKTPFKVIFGDRSVTPTVNSTFRINLTATPQDLAVIDGRVQVQGASDSYLAEIPQGKTIQFQPSGNAQYTIANWIAPNGFDDWNDQLDQEAAQQAKNQTPARVQQGGGSMMDSGLGWSDLDDAGGWYPLPGYGNVWQPYGVGPGFNPYGYGMWANFGGGFGYSWISGYPWGWLPFNCGSWSYIGSFGWGWMPGAYGCGGFGFGYGGYGYGRYWRRGLYGHTNIASAPAGYRAPTPPAIVKGQTAQRIVPVGNQQTAMRNGGLRTMHGNGTGRTVNFNGTKIAPLHSMMSGVRVPTRNAALYNNYPAHADVRAALLEHNVSGLRGDPLASHDFGGGNRAAFGQHTSFGAHGTFGGAHSSYAGGFHSTGGFRGGSMGRSSGGFSGGGFHGGGGGGGFHGGGGGGGGHSGH